MAQVPTISGGYSPIQATGLQRGAALARILAFENTMHKRLGNTRPIRYWRLFNYYSQQNLPPDNVEQPLQINLFKTICDRHNNYLWGQWTKNIVSFRVKPRRGDKPEDDLSKKIKYWLDDFWDANERNALLRRGGHNAAVYGDAIFRLRWDRYERRVVVETILPEYVHFRWDPNNIHKVTEAIVAYPIDRLDAEEWYGTTGRPEIDFNLINPEYMPGFGIYWEHWTDTTYHRWI